MTFGTLIHQETKIRPQKLSRYTEELVDLVRSHHPEALFRGPSYLSDEGLWIIEAFFGDGEDFVLQTQLSERETDILIAHNIWLCVVPMPLSRY